jgi:hypothetical protein
MSDYESVCNLIVTYGLYADSGRWGEWVELFQPDAVLTVRGVDYRGHAEIATAVEDFYPFRMMRHLFHLPWVNVINDHEAQSRSYVELRAVTGRNNDLEAIGVYEDSIVRVGTDWRFATRNVTFDYWGRRGGRWGDGAESA